MKADTPEQIHMCLHCVFPECVNCLEGKDHGKPIRNRDEQKCQVKKYAALGMTDKEMAARLGVHPNTVLALRKELGIPGLRGGRREQ